MIKFAAGVVVGVLAMAWVIGKGVQQGVIAPPDGYRVSGGWATRVGD